MRDTAITPKLGQTWKITDDHMGLLKVRLDSVNAEKGWNATVTWPDWHMCKHYHVKTRRKLRALVK